MTEPQPTRSQVADAISFLPAELKDLAVDHFLRGYSARDLALMHNTSTREIAAQTREAVSGATQIASYRARMSAAAATGRGVKRVR